jgi:hypothetical protein
MIHENIVDSIAWMYKPKFQGNLAIEKTLNNKIKFVETTPLRPNLVVLMVCYNQNVINL